MVMNGERDGYKWKHTCRHKMSKGERKQGMSLKTKTNKHKIQMSKQIRFQSL